MAASPSKRGYFAACTVKKVTVDMLCSAMLCYAMLCSALLCSALRSSVVLYCTLLYCAVLYYTHPSSSYTTEIPFGAGLPQHAFASPVAWSLYRGTLYHLEKRINSKYVRQHHRHPFLFNIYSVSYHTRSPYPWLCFCLCSVLQENFHSPWHRILIPNELAYCMMYHAT